MSLTIDQSKYPKIYFVALEIGYDNGIINRFKTEEEFLNQVTNLLQTYESTSLQSIENWMSKLSKFKLKQIATGEYSAMMAIVNRYSNPVSLDDLLNKIFEL